MNTESPQLLYANSNILQNSTIATIGGPTDIDNTIKTE